MKTPTYALSALLITSVLAAPIQDANGDSPQCASARQTNNDDIIMMNCKTVDEMLRTAEQWKADIAQLKHDSAILEVEANQYLAQEEHLKHVLQSKELEYEAKKKQVAEQEAENARKEAEKARLAEEAKHKPQKGKSKGQKCWEAIIHLKPGCQI